MTDESRYSRGPFNYRTLLSFEKWHVLFFFHIVWDSLFLLIEETLLPCASGLPCPASFWIIAMDHLHVVFDALHDANMQRQVPVCMLLNECFSPFSPSLLCAFRRQLCGRWVISILFFKICSFLEYPFSLVFCLQVSVYNDTSYH